MPLTESLSSFHEKITEIVVIVSEREYNDLLKAKRNAEYLAMLDESEARFKAGNTISFSMEELKEMEEDWKPSQKVLDFERRNNIKRSSEQ